VQYDGETGVASLQRAFSSTPHLVKPNFPTTQRLVSTPFINGRFFEYFLDGSM
jgi:hypothetical protein